MAFMKKQVNLFLVLLTIIGIILIAGMSILYQERLSAVNEDYLESSDSLAVCEENLASTMEELTTTKAQLDANIVDVDKTLDLFEEKEQEVLQQKNLLSQATQENTRLAVELEEAKQRVRTLQNLVESKEDEISLLLTEIQELEEEIDYCRSLLDE